MSQVEALRSICEVNEAVPKFVGGTEVGMITVARKRGTEGTKVLYVCIITQHYLFPLSFSHTRTAGTFKYEGQGLD